MLNLAQHAVRTRFLELSPLFHQTFNFSHMLTPLQCFTGPRWTTRLISRSLNLRGILFHGRSLLGEIRWIFRVVVLVERKKNGVGRSKSKLKAYCWWKAKGFHPFSELDYKGFGRAGRCKMSSEHIFIMGPFLLLSLAVCSKGFIFMIRFSAEVRRGRSLEMSQSGLPGLQSLRSSHDQRDPTSQRPLWNLWNFWVLQMRRLSRAFGFMDSK